MSLCCSWNGAIAQVRFNSCESFRQITHAPGRAMILYRCCPSDRPPFQRDCCAAVAKRWLTIPLLQALALQLGKTDLQKKRNLHRSHQ